MIREYVEHQFNGTMQRKSSTPPHRQMWFARAVIRCDGVEHAYAAVDRKQEKAEAVLRIYLDPRCICLPPSNERGLTPPCPVHAVAL